MIIEEKFHPSSRLDFACDSPTDSGHPNMACDNAKDNAKLRHCSVYCLFDIYALPEHGVVQKFQSS